MVRIQTLDLKNVLKDHLQKLLPVINRNFNNYRPQKSYSEIFEFIKTNINDVLIGNPQRLWEIISDVEELKTKCHLNSKQIKKMNTLFKRVFNYETFSKNGAHTLAKKLKVDTCPYCNRNYTFTVYQEKGQFKTRPQFDHYYCQTNYRYLALSFYNLIPSCSICNLAKHSYDNFQETSIFHPYKTTTFFSRFGTNIKKAEDIIGNSEELKLKIVYKNDDTKTVEEGTIKLFGIEELYQNHIDLVNEILKKAIIYNQTQINDLYNNHSNLFNSKDEVFNLIFGNYVCVEHEICKRPMAKLTRDILIDLGIIRENQHDFYPQ